MRSPKRKRSGRRDDKTILLAHCLTWFEHVLDGEEGVRYLNGQSQKYRGDAWAHAANLRHRLRKAVQ